MNGKNEPPVDPLQREFVPIEKRNSNGVWVFRTSDDTRYTRDPHGVIRRRDPKVRKRRRRVT